MGKYRTLGVDLDRQYRNDLNANFTDIDTDVQAQRKRVDDLIVGTPQPSEVVDARGGKTVLKDRLDAFDTSLAENTSDATILKDNVKGHTNKDEIGTTRNLAQQNYVFPTRITNPVIPDAPTVKNIPYKGIDIIGHWYNDFGLEKTAASSTQANGAYLWYDWRWNFTNNTLYDPYDPSRHPLLGWYQGDDAKTLDWQCYWLAESGVNVVSLVNDIDTSKWSDPTNYNYWIYVLFNQVKNFKSLKYITWLKYGRSQAEIAAGADAVTVCNAQHTDAINNIIGKYNNFHIYNYNGKKYPVVYIWDSESVRGVYDNYSGVTNTKAHYKSLAASLQTMGYDGICIIARGLNVVDGGAAWTTAHLTDLENSGVILLSGSYETCYDTHANYSNSYTNYANNVVFPTDKYKVLNVVTSAKTAKPHPSGWTLAGSTPDLFKAVLQKAVNHASSHSMPKMVTIYNVAEWAEGGPGLQPNMRDGFGYLDAVRSISANGREHIDFSKSTKQPINLKSTITPTQGINSGYSASAVSVTPYTGLSVMEPMKVKIDWGTGFRSSETVTVMVRTYHADGTNTSVEKAGTAQSTVWLTDDDLLTLYKTNTNITSMNFYAKTSYTSGVVPVTITLLAISR